MQSEHKLLVTHAVRRLTKIAILGENKQGSGVAHIWLSDMTALHHPKPNGNPDGKSSKYENIFIPNKSKLNHKNLFWFDNSLQITTVRSRMSHHMALISSEQ